MKPSNKTLVTQCYALSLLLVFTFLACDKQHSPGPQAPVVTASLKLAMDATLGVHLTDSKGRSLYIFTPDIDGTSKCAGGCLLTWPAFYDSLISAATIPPELNLADFTTTTSTAGGKQIAYKGWPLYYYAPKDAGGTNVPEAAGEVKGENIGKVWFVAKSTYNMLLATKPVVNVTKKDTTQKEFLTDSAGNTLYYFGKDELKPDSLSTNCIGGCIATWPVFHGTPANIPSLLVKTEFGEITRNDGPAGTTRKQSTYRGRPLYYFTPDAFTRGTVKGEGVGNIWFVMNPDIAPIPH